MLHELLSWLTQYGIEAQGWQLVAVEDKGYGLRCIDAEPSVRVPRALLITGSSARACEAVANAIAALAVYGPVSRPLCIVLQLAYERSLGSASRWAPYLSLLPSPPHTLLHAPLTPQQEERLLCALQGTPLAAGDGSLSVARAQLRRVLALVCAVVSQPDWCSAAALLWAHAAFTSRALSVPVWRAPSEGFALRGLLHTEPAMVPLIDMANHSPRSMASFHGMPSAPRGGGGSSSGGGSGSGSGSSSGTQADGHTDSHVAMFDRLDLAGMAAAVSAAVSEAAAQEPAAKRLRTVEPAPSTGSSSSTTMSGSGAGSGGSSPPDLILRCDPSLKPGDEITISYGWKCSEELLLWYGFAIHCCACDTLPVTFTLTNIPAAAAAADVDARVECGLQLHAARSPQLSSVLQHYRIAAAPGADAAAAAAADSPSPAVFVLTRWEPCEALHAAVAQALQPAATAAASSAATTAALRQALEQLRLRITSAVRTEHASAAEGQEEVPANLQEALRIYKANLAAIFDAQLAMLDEG